MSTIKDAESVIVTQESVAVSGRTVEHNELPWRVATNRHPNTDGTDWGWIDKAPGNVCWSNNNNVFDRTAAAEMVRAHNQWLEDQQPLPLKIIKAKREFEQANSEFTALEEKHTKAATRLAHARATLDDLLRARDQEPS